MTTLEPGARVVLTHGLVSRPRSTAFLASSPAASMTDGFDVLVQLVMAAMTTWPWSRSNSEPSANRTWTADPSGTDAPPPGPWVLLGRSSPGPPLAAGGSLAGKDSALASSSLVCTPMGGAAVGAPRLGCWARKDRKSVV